MDHSLSQTEDAAESGPGTPDPSTAASIQRRATSYGDALALKSWERLRLLGQRVALEIPSERNAREFARLLADRLGEPGRTASALAGLSRGARLGLTLLALTETRPWPMKGFFHALRCLNVDADEAFETLEDRGLVTTLPLGSAGQTEIPTIAREVRSIDDDLVIPHPVAAAAARTALPEAPDLPRATSVRQIRESDGLEPILRLAVVWQRVAESPLRQTQNGTFYKRDRERLDDDPAIAGPISDAIEPLPDMPLFWLSLARGVGLVTTDSESDRVAAASADFWSENAYHLPQMITHRWLSLWDWHELGGMQQDGAEVLLALPFTRIPILLWLAALGPDDWVATDDLASHLRALVDRWDRPAFQGPSNLNEIRPNRSTSKRSRDRSQEVNS